MTDPKALVERSRFLAAGQDDHHSVCITELCDALDAAEARIEELRAVQEWQPIETAPKDGTEILGYRKDCGVILIRWTAPIHFCTELELKNLGVDDTEKEDWFFADFISGDRLEEETETPTHWMPLPSVPEKEEPKNSDE